MSASVTVGLPVYNGEAYISTAIESVLTQDHADFTLLISDNGSTDRTEDICRAYADQDPRIDYYRHEVNRGAAWNYNYLLGRASSPYFKWQAADDAIKPSFLSRCVDVLESCPDVVLCYAPAEYVGPDGEHRRFVHNPEGYATAAAAAVRVRSALRTTTHCFEVFGVTRTDALRVTRRIGAYPASDVVLLAELALLGRFVQLSEPLFLHRMHRERSVFQYADKRDLVKWYTPDSDRLLLPRWRLLAEFARAFSSLSVSYTARAQALAALGPWAWSHRMQLMYDVAASLPGPVAKRAEAYRDRRRPLRGRAGAGRDERF